MKRILTAFIFFLLSFGLYAQTDNLIEYTIQVKETDSSYAIIVGGNDFINADYYKTRIDIGLKETVDEVINRLNKLHFNVKATSTVNGKQVITMAIKVDQRLMETYLEEMLRIADELDKIYNQMIEYGN